MKTLKPGIKHTFQTPDKRFVIELDGPFVYCREKGKRLWVETTIGVLHDLMARHTADSNRLQRAGVRRGYVNGIR